MEWNGGKLKALRSAKKWDQHKLAEEARKHGTGVTQSQISRYESGKEPLGRNALALARALGEPVSAFYDGAESVEGEISNGLERAAVALAKLAEGFENLDDALQGILVDRIADGRKVRVGG